MNSNTDFIDRLDYHTTISMLNMLLDKRGNYDNNITNKELEQLEFLKSWYSDTHNEV